jgi:glyoxylase-like metal-dependent hydrolase (beta-lactamase superfamily II)
MGVAPERVTDLVLTHAHHDHTEAARHFKNATVYIEENECERARAKGFLDGAARVVTFAETLDVAETESAAEATPAE